MTASLQDLLKFKVFVQVNDLYHINALMDPRDPESLILPRVATVLSRLRLEYDVENIIFCLPGDFLNPANLSRIHRGEQMVDVLNQMGLQIASFGNHEFDFSDHFTPDDLAQRVRQSNFTWLTSNYVPSGEFGDQVLAKTLRIRSMIGPHPIAEDHSLYIVGLMFKSSFRHVGRFTDPIEACGHCIGMLKEDFDDFKGARVTLVALTHQDEENDVLLGQEIPPLRLIMGGHDHDVAKRIGGSLTAPLIVKALSNARSVRLNFVGWLPREVMVGLRDLNGQLPQNFPQTAAALLFEPVLETALGMHAALEATGDPDIRDFVASYHDKRFDIAAVRVHDFKDDGCAMLVTAVIHTTHPGFAKLVEPDPVTTTLIREWMAAAGNYGKVLTVAPVTLDTDDESGRGRSTNFGNFVTDCFRGRHAPAGPVSPIGLMDGGSFRLDRKIPEGEAITEGTLGDLLFYDNKLLLYSVRGDVLLQILNASLRVHPRGGDFLQLSGLEVVLSGSSRSWVIESVTVVDDFGAREPLQADRMYTVATTSYVANDSNTYKALFATGTFERQLAPCVREFIRAEIEGNGMQVADGAARWVFPT